MQTSTTTANGYTLLELLVVLTIVVMALLLLAPSGLRLDVGAQGKSADELAQLLEGARSRAASEGRVITLTAGELAPYLASEAKPAALTIYPDGSVSGPERLEGQGFALRLSRSSGVTWEAPNAP